MFEYVQETLKNGGSDGKLCMELMAEDLCFFFLNMWRERKNHIEQDQGDN